MEVFLGTPGLKDLPGRLLIFAPRDSSRTQREKSTSRTTHFAQPACCHARRVYPQTHFRNLANLPNTPAVMRFVLTFFASRENSSKQETLQKLPAVARSRFTPAEI